MKKITFPIIIKTKSKAQGMVEFALALPVLLLLVFGIIEFGRLMQAWLALENGARFAVRYAVTGNFDTQYCYDAAQAVASDLGVSVNTLRAQDHQDGQYDCRVPDVNHGGWADWEDKSNALQDWARMLSIRDTGLAGATGVSWDSSVSGDYSDYLTTRPVDVDALGNKADLMGIPNLPSFLAVSICSNRSDTEQNIAYKFDPNPHYYDQSTPDDAARYPSLCYKVNATTNGKIFYSDDAGGPGDRVRVTMTYRHTLITPFMSSWWPTLRLTSVREGLVEKFRASRVTGLTGGISAGATYTPVPTETPTATATELPAQCNGTGLLLEEWDNILPSSNTISSLLSWPDYVYYNPTSFNTNWLGQNGTLHWPPSGTSYLNNYGLRMRGKICPPYDGNYTFYLSTDDNASFYLNTSPGMDGVPAAPLLNGTCCTAPSSISSAASAGPVYLAKGQWHQFEILFKEATGNDYVALGWKGPGIGDGNTVTMVEGQFLVPLPKEEKPPEADCRGTGPIFEYWEFLNTLIGLTTGGPADLAKFRLTVVPTYYPNAKNNPGLADSYVNYAERFGTNMRAKLCAPYTGEYTFYVASDDASELYLSADQNPPGIKIAQVDGFTDRPAGGPNWTKYPGIQNSNPIPLIAGQLYYIQAFQTDGTSSDNLSVGWKAPFMTGISIIPMKYLYPEEPRPTPPPTASCDDVVAQKPAEGLYLDQSNRYLNVPVRNNNLYHDAFITQLDTRWFDSVTNDTLNAWHNNIPGETRPAISLNRYESVETNASTGASSTVPMLGTTGTALVPLTTVPGAAQTWSHLMTTKQGTIFSNSPTNIRYYMSRNWRIDNNTRPIPPYPTGTEFNYYYGSDFEVTVHYNIGDKTDCTKTFSGLSGPYPSGPGNTWWTMLTGTNGKFNIQARPASPGNGRTMNAVYMSVYRNSDNALVHAVTDTSSAAFCLFNQSANPCPTNMATFAWNQLPAGQNQVTQGTYTLVIQSRDNSANWSNSRYHARIIDTFTVTQNLPAPPTPTATTPVTPTTVTVTATTPVVTITTPAPTTPVTPTATTPIPTTVTPVTPTTPAPTEPTEPPCPPEIPGCGGP